MKIFAHLNANSGCKTFMFHYIFMYDLHEICIIIIVIMIKYKLFSFFAKANTSTRAVVKLKPSEETFMSNPLHVMQTLPP